MGTVKMKRGNGERDKDPRAEGKEGRERGGSGGRKREREVALIFTVGLKLED